MNNNNQQEDSHQNESSIQISMERVEMVEDVGDE